MTCIAAPGPALHHPVETVPSPEEVSDYSDEVLCDTVNARLVVKHLSSQRLHES